MHTYKQALTCRSILPNILYMLNISFSFGMYKNGNFANVTEDQIIFKKKQKKKF